MRLSRILKALSVSVVLLASAIRNADAGDGLAREDGVRLLAVCKAAQAFIEGRLTDQTLRADAQLCIGFLEGFAWGHGWSAWRQHSDMYFCPPEGFGYREAVPVVVHYLELHRERQIQRAHLLVFAALSQAYPCTP